MVFDTDKFISCIQNNPSIWEVGSKDYINRNIKEKSWNTIGEYCFKNWTEKSNTEKQNTAGFSHRDIDYNTVKLCFQAIIMGSQAGQYYQLEPVVSDSIPDKKIMTGLMIYRLSHTSAPITGNAEIILCDKVMKDDIEIRFFEIKNGNIIWDCLADFKPSEVHKQTAICFKTPTYYLKNIENPVHVKIQLRRLSDGKCGECYPFILIPDFSDFKNRKRIRISRDSFNQGPRNLETIPENSRSSSDIFCQPLNSNVYNQFSSEYEWTPLTYSKYQLKNENSNTFCGQTKVKDQTPTAVYMDQQLNNADILTTNQYNTFEFESIKEILEIGSDSNSIIQSPSNTSVYIKPSSTLSWTNSSIENQLTNENCNKMYGQAALPFQPNIDSSTYSTITSTASPALSSQISDVFDLLSKYSTEINHSSNNTDISISGLCNIDDLLDDIENLSANLSSGLSI